MTRNSLTGSGCRVLALALSSAILAGSPPPVPAQTYRIDTLIGDFDPLEVVPLSRAWTDHPAALAIDADGNIYFAESATGRVRKIDGSGRVSAIAGSGLTGDSGDGGPATSARFGRIEGLAIDYAGNIYIADAKNNRIRHVDTYGTIETIAGTGEFGWDGDGGPATSATLTEMSRIAADGQGNLYIADTWSDRIRKIDESGTITTIAGSEEAGRGGDGGPATSAQLNRPHGVAVDDARNVYIADTENHQVRRIDVSGTITTCAGTGDEGNTGDGGMATDIQLSEPYVRGRHVRGQSAGPASGVPGIEELVVGPIPRFIRNKEVEVVAVVGGKTSNAVMIAFE